MLIGVSDDSSDSPRSTVTGDTPCSASTAAALVSHSCAVTSLSPLTMDCSTMRSSSMARCPHTPSPVTSTSVTTSLPSFVTVMLPVRSLSVSVAVRYRDMIGPMSSAPAKNVHSRPASVMSSTTSLTSTLFAVWSTTTQMRLSRACRLSAMRSGSPTDMPSTTTCAITCAASAWSHVRPDGRRRRFRNAMPSAALTSSVSPVDFTCVTTPCHAGSSPAQNVSRCSHGSTRSASAGSAGRVISPSDSSHSARLNDHLDQSSPDCQIVRPFGSVIVAPHRGCPSRAIRTPPSRQ